MGLLDDIKEGLGTVVGGAIGFIVGGPAGALAGASLGSGVDSRRAAGKAADEQRESGERALDFIRGDLGPFRESGIANLPIAQEAANQAQNISLQTPQQTINNPFFQAVANDQAQNLIGQRAALGLGGSSGTRDALIKNRLLLGNQFQQQDLQNQISVNAARFNPAFQLAQQGANAAAQTGTQSAGIAQGIGNVNAAGIVGQQNAITGTLQNLLNLGGQFSGFNRPDPSGINPFSGGTTPFSSGEFTAPPGVGGQAITFEV